MVVLVVDDVNEVDEALGGRLKVAPHASTTPASGERACTHARDETKKVAL